MNTCDQNESDDNESVIEFDALNDQMDSIVESQEEDTPTLRKCAAIKQTNRVLSKELKIHNPITALKPSVSKVAWYN